MIHLKSILIQEIDIFFFTSLTAQNGPRLKIHVGNVSQDTLYKIILRIARNLLEIKENIKIESHPFYHMICDRF